MKGEPTTKAREKSDPRQCCPHRERRGAVVWAVTHELRTPLTTFRMYTEMLPEGMLRDEEKRRQYLDALRAETDRLEVISLRELLDRPV